MLRTYRIEIVTAALMSLAATSWGLSGLSLGWLGIALALGIAAIKAVLVAIELMELRDAPLSLRIVAVVAPLFVMLVVGFALGDVVSR